MRAARFQVSDELLREALHMPAGTRIIGASCDPAAGTVSFVVDDPQLPEADEPHDAAPVVTAEVLIWDWGVT